MSLYKQKYQKLSNKKIFFALWLPHIIVFVTLPHSPNVQQRSLKHRAAFLSLSSYWLNRRRNCCNEYAHVLLYCNYTDDNERHSKGMEEVSPGYLTVLLMCIPGSSHLGILLCKRCSLSFLQMDSRASVDMFIILYENNT